MGLLQCVLGMHVTLARFGRGGRLIRGLLEGDPVAWGILVVLGVVVGGTWLYKQMANKGGRDGMPRRRPRRSRRDAVEDDDEGDEGGPRAPRTGRTARGTLRR